MPIQNITGPGYSHSTFVVDSIVEVDQVPVKTLATTVLCLEDGQTRVADSQGGWHVFPTTTAPVFDNYTLLNNKPTLNGVTLNGDLTSSDVNVQGKLTAGSNIVISEDGTISAVGSGEGVVINVTDSEMVKGHRVPKLTPDDVVLAYNALVNGGSCTITDEISDTDVQNFSVTQADTFEGDAGQDICVMITYYDKMILTYKLESDTVTISSTDIGGGGDLIVSVTESDGTYTADKTFEEIAEAYPNAKVVDENNIPYMPFEKSDSFIGFASFEVALDGAIQYHFSFYADESISYVETKYPQGE